MKISAAAKTSGEAQPEEEEEEERWWRYTNEDSESARVFAFASLHFSISSSRSNWLGEDPPPVDDVSKASCSFTDRCIAHVRSATMLV